MKKILKCSDDYLQQPVFCRDAQFWRLFFIIWAKILKNSPSFSKEGCPQGGVVLLLGLSCFPGRNLIQSKETLDKS